MIKTIEEKIEEDDGTAAMQTVKLLEDKGYITIEDKCHQSQEGFRLELSQQSVSAAILLRINGSRFTIKVNNGYPLTEKC